MECFHGIHPVAHDIAADVAPAAVDVDAADWVVETTANDENIKLHGMPTSTTSTGADQLRYAPCVSHCRSTCCSAMRSTLLRVSSLLHSQVSWTRSGRRGCFLSFVFYPL